MVRFTPSPSFTTTTTVAHTLHDADMHQRPQNNARSISSSQLQQSPSRLSLSMSRFSSKTELLPSVMPPSPSTATNAKILSINSSTAEASPSFCGLPLKYVSLLTLAIQNATLSIVMHYSRVSTPPSQAYSPAAAVLMNEILKGSISFLIAFMNSLNAPPSTPLQSRRPFCSPLSWTIRLQRLCAEIFSPDCWKLSIPAILYVIQNSLQFVAISNLPVASFQVAYQMKIMTTAAFSVALLGKRLSRTKWLSLLFLALGVGIVQIQTASGNGSSSSAAAAAAAKHVSEAVGSAAAAAPKHMHIMNPLKGFAAVIAACFTSGLAGVYFEMVLKNSKADLWVRNVQLSLFSLVPALLPILYTSSLSSSVSHGIFHDLFKNFGVWAWATVAIQVFGGLVTAIVIKYSDNILKGFATSLSIILSFLASVALFNFQITTGFLSGSIIVLLATAMYNQPATSKDSASASSVVREKEAQQVLGSPVSREDPILGEKPALRTSASFSSSTQSLVNFFSRTLSSSASDRSGNLSTTMATAVSSTRNGDNSEMLLHSLAGSRLSLHTPLGTSPYSSRSPSPPISETSVPIYTHKYRQWSQ